MSIHGFIPHLDGGVGTHSGIAVQIEGQILGSRRDAVENSGNRFEGIWIQTISNRKLDGTMLILNRYVNVSSLFDEMGLFFKKHNESKRTDGEAFAYGSTLGEAATGWLRIGCLLGLATKKWA